MDYNSLKALIISYTNRNEPVFISAIPTLIEQAMSSIYSDAKTIGFQKTITGNMVSGRSNIDKPVDYKASINLSYVSNSVNNFLLPRSYEFCIKYWPIPANLNAPIFYSADLDVPQNDAANSAMYLAPTPDQNYPYQFTYLSFPPVFNETATRNFLTDRYPDLLLAACLVKAIPFLKCDERAALFRAWYSEALERVNRDTKERYTDRGTKRDKD